jgi:hypothetical protein
MTDFLLIAIVGLLIWIGRRLKPPSPTGWEYLIKNVTGDIQEMTASLNDRGLTETVSKRELVMIWSPPRADDEWASILRSAVAQSEEEAREVKTALEKLDFKPYPRQIYAIFKKRVPVPNRQA